MISRDEWEAEPAQTQVGVVSRSGVETAEFEVIVDLQKRSLFLELKLNFAARQPRLKSSSPATRMIE
jgi:hypothetical protein